MLMRLLRICLCLTVILFAAGPVLPAWAAAPAALPIVPISIVTALSFTPSSPNILAFGDQVSYTATYSTSYPAGVVITVVPYSSILGAPEAPTPNVTGTGPQTVPVGTGQISGTFTVTAGAVTVDQVRILLQAADTHTTLPMEVIPVSFQFTGLGNRVTNITMSPTSPNILTSGEVVTVPFHFRTNPSVNLKVSAIPFSAGSPTAGAALTPSGTVLGSGTSQASFSLTASVDTIVDQINLHLTDPTGTTTLADFFVPVNYRVLPSGTATYVTDISLSPPMPDILHSGQNISLTFHYATSEVNGVRIVGIPYSLGVPSQGGVYSPSPLYPTGSGSGAGTFTLSAHNGLVGAVLIEVFTANQSTLLYKKVLPVHYEFTGTLFAQYLPLLIR